MFVILIIVLVGLSATAFANSNGIIAAILAGIVIALTASDQKRSTDSIDTFYAAMGFLLAIGVLGVLLNRAIDWLKGFL